MHEEIDYANEFESDSNYDFVRGLIRKAEIDWSKTTDTRLQQEEITFPKQEKDKQIDWTKTSTNPVVQTTSQQMLRINDINTKQIAKPNSKNVKVVKEIQTWSEDILKIAIITSLVLGITLLIRELLGILNIKYAAIISLIMGLIMVLSTVKEVPKEVVLYGITLLVLSNTVIIYRILGLFLLGVMVTVCENLNNKDFNRILSVMVIDILVVVLLFIIKIPLLLKIIPLLVIPGVVTVGLLWNDRREITSTRSERILLILLSVVGLFFLKV